MANITDYIATGKENAIHLCKLSETIGVTPEKCKDMIRKARRSGAQIVSSGRGYWLAESEEEMQAYYDMMRKQALSRLLTIKPIMSTLNQINGQLSLSDVFEGVSVDGK